MQGRELSSEWGLLREPKLGRNQGQKKPKCFHPYCPGMKEIPQQAGGSKAGAGQGLRLQDQGGSLLLV